MGRFVTRRWEGATSYDYQSFVPWPWPDGGRGLVLSYDVIAETSKAVRALESLTEYPGTNPALWLLYGAESLGSSAMEGIQPSEGRVALADERRRIPDEDLSDDDHQALSNIAVTGKALQLASTGRGITLSDICDLNSVLLSPDTRAGTLREQPNWIDVRRLSDGPRHAVYVPPPAECVKDLMDDLVRFMNQSSHNPIVTAAVAHVQFESIHPFADGNGRVGRALIQYVLASRGLLRGAPVPASAALALKRREYSDALNASRVRCDEPEHYVRSQSLTQWIHLLSTAAIEAADYRSRIEQHVGRVETEWNSRLSEIGPRSDSSAYRGPCLICS